MTIVFALACVGMVFWFGSTILTTTPVPPAQTVKPRVRFDASVDISKHPVFRALEPVVATHIDKGSLGRSNPFVAVQSVVIPTSTFLGVTSTPPIIPVLPHP